MIAMNTYVPISVWLGDIVQDKIQEIHTIFQKFGSHFLENIPVTFKYCRNLNCLHF